MRGDAYHWEAPAASEAWCDTSSAPSIRNILRNLPVSPEQAEWWNKLTEDNNKIEQLWKEGQQEASWAKYKQVYGKVYDNPQVDKKHFEAFAEAVEDLVSAKERVARTGAVMPSFGLTAYADRVRGESRWPEPPEELKAQLPAIYHGQ